jgi:hypothetical protein
MMSKATASVRTFDDTLFIAKIEAFRAYLAETRQLHHSTMERLQPFQNSGKADKPKRKPTAKMTFVYLLPAGVNREPLTASSSRHCVAPLWASIGDDERNKAA